MTLANLLAGGAVVAVLSIIQISPIKINPWSGLGKLFKWLLNSLGRATNGDVLGKLDEVTCAQQKAQTQLDRLETRMENHIKADDERDADAHRAKILQFNNELLRDIPHTKEEFIEILHSIDVYERFCNEHPDYRNNRAVHAIANIGRVYDDRLQKHDFLQDGTKEE